MMSETRPQKRCSPGWSLWPALRTVPPTRVRQVRQLLLAFRPAKDFSFFAHPGRYTYQLDAGEASFGWSNGTVPPDVTEMVEVYMHGHGELLIDLLFFQGQPAAVFADVGAVSRAQDCTSCMVRKGLLMHWRTCYENELSRTLRCSRVRTGPLHESKRWTDEDIGESLDATLTQQFASL